MHVAFPCLPGVTSGPIAACKGVTASVCVKILFTVLYGTFNSGLAPRVDLLVLRRIL